MIRDSRECFSERGREEEDSEEEGEGGAGGEEEEANYKEQNEKNGRI